MTGVPSPLAGWYGGKRRLSALLLSLVPEHRCYVEPFSGAAWLLFRKPRSRVLNDLDRDVVTLFRVAQNHLPEFLRCLALSLASRDEHSRLALLPPEALTDIQRAVRFFTLLKLSFNGRASTPSFSCSTTNPPRLDPRRLTWVLEAARDRLAGVYLECLDFEACLKRWDRPGTFFYLDPPYPGRDRVYGRGLFSRQDYERLAQALSRLRGRFLLSLNDSPFVRRVFGGFEIASVAASYSCARAEGTSACELLIFNYGLTTPEQLTPVVERSLSI